MTEFAPGGLSCSQVLAQLSDFLDGELAPPARAAIEAHVRQRVRCAQFGGAVAAVLQGLRRQVGGGAAAGFDAQTAGRLAEALRRAR